MDPITAGLNLAVQFMIMLNNAPEEHKIKMWDRWDRVWDPIIERAITRHEKFLAALEQQQPK